MINVVVAWLASYMITGWYYYVYFGWSLEKFGKQSTFVSVCIEQLVVCLALIAIYDRTDHDVFGIDQTKEKFHGRMNGARSRVALIGIWMLSFWFINVAFSPFVGTICLRKEGKRGFGWKEWILFVSSIVFVSGYWIAVNRCLVKPAWHLLKHVQ